jgi:hypothetical protein
MIQDSHPACITKEYASKQTLRASRIIWVKARLEGNGRPLVKSRNTEPGNS